MYSLVQTKCYHLEKNCFTQGRGRPNFCISKSQECHWQDWYICKYKRLLLCNCKLCYYYSAVPGRQSVFIADLPEPCRVHGFHEINSGPTERAHQWGISTPNIRPFLSTPVLLHGGLICLAFCLSAGHLTKIQTRK